jgi:hypothetical protein
MIIRILSTFQLHLNVLLRTYVDDPLQSDGDYLSWAIWSLNNVDGSHLDAQIKCSQNW